MLVDVLRHGVDALSQTLHARQRQSVGICVRRLVVTLVSHRQRQLGGRHAERAVQIAYGGRDGVGVRAEGVGGAQKRAGVVSERVVIEYAQVHEVVQTGLEIDDAARVNRLRIAAVRMPDAAVFVPRAIRNDLLDRLQGRRAKMLETDAVRVQSRVARASRRVDEMLRVEVRERAQSPVESDGGDIRVPMFLHVLAVRERVEKIRERDQVVAAQRGELHDLPVGWSVRPR